MKTMTFRPGWTVCGSSGAVTFLRSTRSCGDTERSAQWRCIGIKWVGIMDWLQGHLFSAAQVIPRSVNWLIVLRALVAILKRYSNSNLQRHVVEINCRVFQSVPKTHSPVQQPPHNEQTRPCRRCRYWPDPPGCLKDDSITGSQPCPLTDLTCR